MGEIQGDLKVSVTFRMLSLFRARVWGEGTGKGGQRPQVPAAQLGVHTWTILEKMRKRAGEEAGNLEGFICCLMFLQRNI